MMLRPDEPRATPFETIGEDSRNSSHSSNEVGNSETRTNSGSGSNRVTLSQNAASTSSSTVENSKPMIMTGLVKKRHPSSQYNMEDSDGQTSGTYLSSSSSSDDEEHRFHQNHVRKRIKYSFSSEELVLPAKKSVSVPTHVSVLADGHINKRCEAFSDSAIDSKDLWHSANESFESGIQKDDPVASHYDFGPIQSGHVSYAHIQAQISTYAHNALSEDDGLSPSSPLYKDAGNIKKPALAIISPLSAAMDNNNDDVRNYPSQLRPQLFPNTSLSGNVSPTPSSIRRRRISLSVPLPPHSPIPRYINNKSLQARKAIRQRSLQARCALQNQNLKFKNGIVQYKVYRQKRKAAKRKSRIIVIPSNHLLKVMWDIATVALTFVSAYVGHIYIRDRSTYEWDWFVLFSNVWYFIDLLLNFFTELRTSDGKVIRRGREVWGRYLTTWFAIDALSLLPWERMFLRPIIQAQKRRHFVVKWFFRSKAVVKVTRILKLPHFRAFGNVAKRSKKIGVGGKRLLHLIIKYVPKYVLFYRNMKGVLLLKMLRQIHFAKKIFRGLTSKQDNMDEEDVEIECLADDDGTLNLSSIQHAYCEDFEDDFEFDDDGDDARNGESNDVSEDDGFSDDDGTDDSTDDEADSSTLADAETDYESCADDCDYDIHFSVQLSGIQISQDDDNIVKAE